MSSAIELTQAARHCAAAKQQQWLLLLQAMLSCQETRDGLGLADYLEYELVELLGSGS
jgi:hypothetical protein